MFKDWQAEKATTALIEEAQAMADTLASAKPHVRDSHAAFAQFWDACYLRDGQDLHALAALPPEGLRRFVAATETKIAGLRKQRDYDSSDGLKVWLHTARALAEPRIAPAVRQIWQALIDTGPNAAAMADDLLQDAGLPHNNSRRIPTGFAAEP